MATLTRQLEKRWGRKPDRPDPRDLIVVDSRLRGSNGDHRSPLQEIGAPLPTSVDVFAGLDLPVYDQGQLGSCTANAGVLYRRFLSQCFSKYSAPDENLSRLFLYYQERKLPWNNDVTQDSGASVRDIFYVLAHTGVCPESDDPYVQEDFSSPLFNNNPADLADAAKFRIGAYHRIPGADVAKSVLASGYAIVIGFTVYESFDSIGSDGVMPMPKDGEAVIGGHAVVIRGYEDSQTQGPAPARDSRAHAYGGPAPAGYFRVQNSWGESWGDGGCFWMPYAFIEAAELSQFDMWMGHLGKPWKTAA